MTKRSIRRVTVRWQQAICFFALASASIFSCSAHAFQLVTLEEQKVNLLDYVGDGRWTVIMFWATDCVPCEQQKPAFEEFHQKYHDGIASAVGIATDGVENKAAILKLIEHHKPSYPNLMAYSDVYQRQFEELVGRAFLGTPWYLVFTPDGQLVGSKYASMDFDELGKIVTQRGE